MLPVFSPTTMMGKRYNDMDIGIFWPAKSLRPLICKRWRYHDVFAAHKMNLRQFDKFFGKRSRIKRIHQRINIVQCGPGSMIQIAGHCDKKLNIISLSRQ